LKELSTDMTNINHKSRPNCGKILEKKKLWALNKDEFDAKKYLKMTYELENNALVKQMIISKLKNK
jgi:hypothetical protein